MNTLVETEVVKPQVLFIYIENPMQAADSRVLVAQDHDSTRTLSECLGPLEGDWAVSVSGLVIPKDQWPEVYLRENDCVVVAPLIMGGGQGGGGKQIMRLVALAALTYFTAGAAAGVAGAIGVTSAGGIALVGAGMIMAGTMAINALLPPAQPKVPTSGNDYDSSPTYGIDGPKNMSTRSIPVPVIYGECWFAGNFIQSYIDNVGDDQYLNLLINVGEGPVEGIQEIQINDQPMDNYVGVETWFRDGSENQELIPYFDDIIVPVNRSVNLTNAVYTVHSVEAPVDRLRLDFVLPAGFNHLDDEDGMGPTTVQWTAEIREVGGAWGPFTGGDSVLSVTGKQMSAARRSYYSQTLDRNKRYEIRCIHNQPTDDSNTSNKVTLSDVNYITFDDMTYKHTALLGMRIKLSDQLNGLPSVKYRIKGRKVPVYNVLTGQYIETWTDNPAWITLDVLMNKRYGGQLSANRMKMDYFRKWATFCTQNNLKFNGAIDQRTNLWDACAPICKVGRAQLVRSGTKFQVSLVRKTSPVQLFSMASIKKGSLAIDWMASDERANEVHVTYFDKGDQGKQKTVIVANEAARERGEEARPTEVTLYGVDNVDQATREGTLAMNMQQLLQTISFEAPPEAIACTLGDVIAIQHDMPDWGQGGFTDVGSTKTKLVIDKPVSMPLGGNYVVQVRHDSLLQGTWEAEAVVGNIVVPTGPFNVQMFERYRRLVTPGNGRDYEIEEAVIDQFGRHGLRLSTTAGISVGDTIQLWDTNVIETRNVATFDDERMTITPTVPFSAVPRAESPWAFGLYESVTQMLTVMNIGGKDDMWKQISGIEYKDDAYDDTVIDYRPDPINTSPEMPVVVFNGFQERRYLIGASYTSDIEMTWASSDINYSYCEVHIRIDDESWKFMDANATLYTLINISSGKIQLKLVPVTIEGFKPNFGSVPIYTYEIVGGVPRVPPVPLNFRPGVITGDIIELLWGDLDAWSASQNVYKYEVFHAGYKDARIEDAQLIAVTGNNHYPHIGLERLSWHTYWLRATNTQAANSKSQFAGPLSLQVIDNDPYGLVDLTNIANDLREAIDYPKILDDLSVIVANATTKLEEATDEQKQEVFNREQAVGDVRAYVNETVGAFADENEAQAIRLTTLEATTNASTQAKIDELTQVVVNGDSSLAQRISLMQVKFADDLSAAILTEQQARADALGAIASQVTTLNTTVGENTTSLQQTMKVVDGISGQYTLRIDVNGIVSGFGLATGAGGTSEFAIMATRFKIYGPGPGGTVVKTPIFSVNTETGVAYLRNAVVGDLSSDNYISGVSGWCLKK
ncbi:putative tail protein [Pseudomonas phage hairong]|nr:putative tail protein [Pseudomonas phage hairong]